MTTKPQPNFLLRIKSSRTRRKCNEDYDPDQFSSRPVDTQLMHKYISAVPEEDRLSPENVPKICHPSRRRGPQNTPTILLVSVSLPFLFLFANATNSTNFTLGVVPTSVSKAYTDIPTWNVSRSTISRPFYTRMTPGDAKQPPKVIPKPSKLFTSTGDDEGFDQTVFDSTTEGKILESTTKRGTSFSPFLTQTDTGPKIRLEPFFNILSTFQSLALGSSKEQKFSPSYQAVAQSVGAAEAELKARREEKQRNRNKGVKGLRNKRPKGSENFMASQVSSQLTPQLTPGRKRSKNKKKDKDNKFVPMMGGPLSPIPLPERVVNLPPSSGGGEETDIITAESLAQDQGDVNPMDVLSVSMSTSMSLGEGISGSSNTTSKAQGTVEDVPISQPQPESLISITTPSLGLSFLQSPPESGFSPSGKSVKRKKNRKHFSFTQQQPGQSVDTANATDSGPGSKERRLRSETNFFENFHHSEADLLAQESHGAKLNTNIPSGYALPQEEHDQGPLRTRENFQLPHQHLASKYPVSFVPQPQPQLPPPGLGLPPKSFFRLSQSIPKRPSFSPNVQSADLNYSNNYGNIDHSHANHLSKPVEASSDLSEQQNVADSKLEVFNPHQKIGVMSGFELFYKQYKILAWGSFFVITTLALFCLIVYLYTNSPPTEVVTAKGLLSRWVAEPSPQILAFLSSIYEWNEKGGGSGKGRRKRYKMKKRRRNGGGLDEGSN